MAIKNKKKYSRYDFSDEEVYNQIKEEIRQIKEMNLKEVDEERKIMILYDERKKEKKKKQRLKSNALKQKIIDSKMIKNQHDLGEEDEEEGEINENYKPQIKDRYNEMMFQGVPQISNLIKHIRPLILTRNKMCDLLNSRKFQQIVKGCFARYKSDSPGSNSTANPAYLVAQIIGVTEGKGQYTINQTFKTKYFLKLQQTSQQIITLSIQNLSNKLLDGSLEIERWLQANRKKIPKENELKQKFKDLTSLINQKITSAEIDKNIYEETMRVVSGKQEVKGDVDRLITFIQGNIHDLTFQIEQIEGVENVSEKIKKREQFQEILDKLKTKKEEFISQQRMKKQQKKDKKEGNKFSQVIFNNRKEDKINDKVKAKLITYSTYQGSMKSMNEIIEAHKKFTINIDI